MEKRNIYNEIKKSISDDKIEVAFELLNDLIKSDNEEYRTFIVLKSQYNSLKHEQMIGTDNKIEKTRFIYRFLQYIEILYSNYPNLFDEKNVYNDKALLGLNNNLNLLIEKYNYLRKELIGAYDTEKKFALNQQIQELEVQISEIKTRLASFSVNEETEWNEIKSNKNSNIQDYENFLKKYPNSKYSVLAIEKIKFTTEEDDYWNFIVLRQNILNAFYEYLSKYPLGKYAEQAKNNLLSLENKYWEEVLKSNTLISYSNYINIYSNGKFLKEATFQINELKKQINLVDDKVIDGNLSSDINKYITIDVKNNGIFILKQQKVLFNIKNQSNDYSLTNILIEISGSNDHLINNNSIYKDTINLKKNESKTIEVEIFSKTIGSVRIDIKICNEFYSPSIYLFAVKDNPYFYGTPVEKETNFIGRENEINIIKSDIQSQKSPRLIVGEQRSGKTSLLYQIRNLHYNSNIIPVYISLESHPCAKKTIFSFFSKKEEKAIETLKWIINQIVFEINLLIENDRYYSFLPRLNVNDFISNFQYPSDFINNLKRLLFLLQNTKKDIKICLLLDEGNEILQIEEKFQLVLRNALNELSKSFTMLLACSNEFLEYTQHSKSSPFKNIFSYSILRPFEGEELNTLIEKPAMFFNCIYSKDAKEKIKIYTGGHPYYTQAFCAKCFDLVFQTTEKRIDLNHVELIFNQILNAPEFKDKFKLGYWNLIKQNSNFVQLLKSIIRDENLKKYPIETIELLENRFIIKKLNDKYIINSKLFKMWLSELL